METEQQNQEFKKQALEFILSIYLSRQNDEDIKFIQENVKSSAEFAKNVSSSIKSGLNEDSVDKNKLLYGRNFKRTLKTFHLNDVILRVLKIQHILIFFICIVQVIFGTVLKNRQIYMDAVYAMILQSCVLLIRIVTIYLNQKKKSQESYDKNKNQKYRVFRDGTFLDLPETKIVVGDIIELDYKEKVPASGLLIANHQIAMNEQLFGKKVQRKMSLEKCISYINKLSLLELKIEAEKQTLPSPIIIRGTQQVYGSTYRILVLAVDEESLLDKYKIPDDSTFVSDVIRDWFQKLEVKVDKIMRVISFIYLILFIFLFGLKEFLERRHLSGEMFFTDLFSVLLMSILGFSVFDTNCLRLFVETQVISYTENLNNPKQVDKYLTVEQIYITENNIVKYDEIVICQIGLPDKQHMVRLQDINVLATAKREKIQQVLEGVGLKARDSQGLSNDLLKLKQDFLSVDSDTKYNQIVHLNTIDQKIFSAFYSPQKRHSSEDIISQKQQNLKFKQKPFFLNSHHEENASNISLNKITPLDEESPFGKAKRNRRKKQMSIDKKSDIHHEQNLKGYLSEFCKFKTQNIVQSIVQLAKKQCKTYYYQKYTFNRLKKIPFLFLNGSEMQMNKERVQKTKRMARNIRLIQNLTPFLIGYSDGAYNNNSMNVLVAVVGVKIHYENQIIQRLKQLETLGIKSSVLIQKREDDDKDSFTKENFLLQSKVTNDFHEEQDYNKVILSQYINRGWISHEAEEIVDFPSLKQSGGRIRCQNCVLSSCDCKNRISELSNIQSFMSTIENVKIIHSVENQSDIHYLKVGSQQILNSVIAITKYKSDTIKILEDIKRGYYLSNILEKGINVWYGFMFVSALCFYPLALVSFGGVFCSGDLSLWTLFIQSLPAIGNLHISIQSKEKTQNSSRRNKVLYSKKSALSVFLLCLISTIVATVFYIHPTMFIHEQFTVIAQNLQEQTGIIFDRDCHYHFSIFLSEDFNKIQCMTPNSTHHSNQLEQSLSTSHMYRSQNEGHFIYSQNISFIFSYLCLNMLIFSMINFRNFTKLKVLGIYISTFGVYFFVIYVEPDIIHARQDGLTPVQLAIAFGMSIFTNLIIQFIAYVSNYSCAVCDTEEFQSILAFEDGIQDHYSSKLKKYSSFETQIYTLN